MSALGHKRTFAVQKCMSALPPIATAEADFRTRSCLLYPESGHVDRTRSCVLWANSGFMHHSEKDHYSPAAFIHPCQPIVAVA
jgi:hypothetical protein